MRLGLSMADDAQGRDHAEKLGYGAAMLISPD